MRTGLRRIAEPVRLVCKQARQRSPCVCHSNQTECVHPSSIGDAVTLQRAVDHNRDVCPEGLQARQSTGVLNHHVGDRHQLRHQSRVAEHGHSNEVRASAQAISKRRVATAHDDRMQAGSRRGASCAFEVTDTPGAPDNQRDARPRRRSDQSADDARSAPRLPPCRHRRADHHSEVRRSYREVGVEVSVSPSRVRVDIGHYRRARDREAAAAAKRGERGRHQRIRRDDELRLLGLDPAEQVPTADHRKQEADPANQNARARGKVEKPPRPAGVGQLRVIPAHNEPLHTPAEQAKPILDHRLEPERAELFGDTARRSVVAVADGS